MEDIESRIHDTLLFIKDNPNCSTNADQIDGNLIKDLQAKGFVEAINCTHISSKSPEFISIRITIDGEIHLSSLSSNATPTSNPMLHSVKPIIITVVGGLIVAAITVFYLQPWQQNIQEKSQPETQEIPQETE